MNDGKYIICELETKIDAYDIKKIMELPYTYGKTLIHEFTRTLQFFGSNDDIYFVDVCDTMDEAREFLEKSTLKDLEYDNQYLVKLRYIMTVTPDDNAMRDCEYIDDDGVEYVWLDEDYSDFDADSLELLERLR